MVAASRANCDNAMTSWYLASESAMEKANLASKIEGFVEEIHAHHATGWAIDTGSRASLQVVLRHAGVIVARTRPAFARTDVEAIYGPGRPAGFFITFEHLGALLQSGAVVEAGSEEAGFVRLLPTADALAVGPPKYQDFDGAGASRSQHKLDALRLDFLTGLQQRKLRVLDIGCNEGFFCDALARTFDIETMLGVDRTPAVIKNAAARFPDLEFRCESWWSIGEDNFDIILFLSAIHYENEQARLLQFLERKLSPRGVLILECGIADPALLDTDAQWAIAHRGDGYFRYPSYKHLTESLLAPFSTKYIGPSTPQAGDPVQRHVLHCWKKKQYLVLIDGRSGSGKTELSNQIANKATTQTIHTDLLILRLLTDDYLAGAPISQQLRVFFTWPADIGLVQQCIIDQSLAEEFVDIIVLTIDRMVSTVIIEGEILGFPRIAEMIAYRTSEFMELRTLSPLAMIR